jgi:hypothetical protein
VVLLEKIYLLEGKRRREDETKGAARCIVCIVIEAKEEKEYKGKDRVTQIPHSFNSCLDYYLLVMTQNPASQNLQ